MKPRILAPIFSLIALVLATSQSSASAGYATFQPGPRGVCLVRKPAITWSIQGTGGATVTGCQMTLNGQTVKVEYDKLSGMVRFTPTETLQPGEYSVACTVELNSQYKVNKNWNFKVSDQALEQLPTPDSNQTTAIGRANELRTLLGLQPFSPSASLCASASSHATFMRTNRLFGHAQQEGLLGFTGVKPIDRAQAFGHQGGLWEDVAMAFETPTGFVDQLFNAPYHRIPFMQPGESQIGIGFDKTFACIDFGSSSSEGTVVSPSNGQTSVPTSWDGIESPTPLRIHNVKGPVGYVIMLSCFTNANEKLVCDEAALSCGGEKVPFYLNTPENDDHLTNTVLIMPTSTLKPNTTYSVSVRAHTASGMKVDKAWSFTTGSK